MTSSAARPGLPTVTDHSHEASSGRSVRDAPEPSDHLACPGWCVSKHPPDWSAHVRNCGEVNLGDVTYSIDLVQYRDELEMVAFCIYADEEARVGNLTDEEARRIHEALGTALALLSGGEGGTPG